jgi:hypothetical protein
MLGLDRSVDLTRKKPKVAKMNDKVAKTQKTRPVKGEPIDIPVPPESQIRRDFEKIATAPVQDEQDEGDNEDQSQTG